MSLNNPSDILLKYLACLRLFESIRKDDIFYNVLESKLEELYWLLDKDSIRIVDSQDINWRPILSAAAQKEGFNVLWYCLRLLTNVDGSGYNDFKKDFLDQLFNER